MNYIILKLNLILILNLIMEKVKNQAKTNLVQLKNAKVNLMKNIMLLKKLNKQKEQLISQNYKQDKKLKM